MRNRVRWMFWKPRRSDTDFAEEIASHLGLEADQLEREGMSTTDAICRAARLRKRFRLEGAVSRIAPDTVA